MEQKQYDDLVVTLGKQAADKINAEMQAYKKSISDLATGTLTKEEFEAAHKSINASVEEVKEIARKQGTTVTDILARLNSNEVGTKSIAQQLQEDKEELVEVYKSHRSPKEYMISQNAKGDFVMRPFDSIKAAGPHATTANVGAGGNVSSVSQSFDATTLLRMAADSPIMRGFRNVPWIFGLVNLRNVGYDNMFFTWFDEQTVQGASATVLEGAAKPAVQYAYDLKSATYKKEAMLVSFTQEFSLDFQRLQDEIINVARIDLVNRLNSAILPNILSNATAYNSAASYAPAGDGVINPNDWDVVAALAAQAENSTFSSIANTAVVSTNKKYRMGTIKTTYGEWVDMPSIFNNMSVVSNPAMSTSNVMVGDFKQYNVALRGGIIVKVGYNGNDFANNMFSTVIEQFYFDYISNLRKAAIVKGPDFDTVKAAIAAA